MKLGTPVVMQTKEYEYTKYLTHLNDKLEKTNFLTAKIIPGNY